MKEKEKEKAKARVRVYSTLLFFSLKDTFSSVELCPLDTVGWHKTHLIVCGTFIPCRCNKKNAHTKEVL